MKIKFSSKSLSKSYIFSLILFFIVISSFLHAIATQSTPTSRNQDQTVKILFDESHIDTESGYSMDSFNSKRNMKEPVQILREQGFTVSVNKEDITVDLLNEKIGEKGLLIICLLDKPVTEEEGAAINEWVRNGGSVFTTTEPDYAGFEYSKGENTNDMLKYIKYNDTINPSTELPYSVYDIMHLYSLAGQSDEIVDSDPKHRTVLTGNPWDVLVTPEQFPDTPLGNALKPNVDSVILGCSSVVVRNNSWVGGYAYNESESQPDGGIAPYNPALDGQHAIPWIAGGEVGNGGKVLLLGGIFTVSGWSLYTTSHKFIEQENNAALWTNIVSWLVDVTITPPVIVVKQKIPLIDFVSMAVGIYAVVFAFSARKGQRRFLRYLLFIALLGIVSTIIGTIQHILFEWQYIGSGLDRYWALPQDADPVQNAAVRYLFAGLAGPVLISVIPALFLMISRTKWLLGKEFMVNMRNLRLSTPEDKYTGMYSVAPLNKRLIAFIIDITPFVILFGALYLFVENSAVAFISRDLFSAFTVGAADTSAITDIDFLALIIQGTIALLLIPLELLAFLIQFTTFSFFVVVIIFFLYYFLCIRFIGGTVGHKIMGIHGIVGYDGKPLETKRLFLKTVFLMFLDSGLFYLTTYFVLSRKDNKLMQSYSDRLVRGVVVNKYMGSEE
ncbi:MAG: hypothetical protein ACFFD4_05060 [Candidatus Odinarchaeota archaeon]